MDMPPMNLNVVNLRFADPHGPESCAEVGLKLNNAPIGPKTTSTCRQGKGGIRIIENTCGHAKLPLTFALKMNLHCHDCDVVTTQ